MKNKHSWNQQIAYNFQWHEAASWPRELGDSDVLYSLWNSDVFYRGLHEEKNEDKKES